MHGSMINKTANLIYNVGVGRFRILGGPRF